MLTLLFCLILFIYNVRVTGVDIIEKSIISIHLNFHRVWNVLVRLSLFLYYYQIYWIVSIKWFVRNFSYFRNSLSLTLCLFQIKLLSMMSEFLCVFECLYDEFIRVNIGTRYDLNAIRKRCAWLMTVWVFQTKRNIDGFLLDECCHLLVMWQ